MTPTRLRPTLDTIATISMIAAASVVMWTYFRAARPRPMAAVPSSKVSIDGAATKGSRSATTALVVYSDFECPFCRAFAVTVLPDIDKRYTDTGQLFVAFRHLPLSGHPNAKRAAQAADCANGVGQFWQLHDMMFRSTRELSEQNVIEMSRVLGLGSRWNECMTNDDRAITADADSAGALGITSTPTVLIGILDGQRKLKATDIVVGTQPLSAYVAIIDRVLRSSTK